jgi:hypothetical protein
LAQLPTHRATLPTLQPRRTHPPAAAEPAIPATTPLQQFEDQLSRLTNWSLLHGPLVWVFSAALLLAFAMITTAVTTGRGSPRLWWRTRSLSRDRVA